MTRALQAKIRKFAANPVAQATALALLATWLGLVFVRAYTLAGPNDPAHRNIDLIGLGVCAVLLVASLIYARDKGRTRTLTYGVWASLAILIAGLVLPYVIGATGDLLHVRCMGFFGVHESCIEHLQLTFILLTTLFPYLLISVPLFLVVLIALLLGVWKSLRR